MSSVRKRSSEASHRTVQRRALALEGVRKELSGGNKHDYKIQQIAEIRRQSQDERKIIAQEVCQ